MTARLSLGHARTQRSFETLYHEHVSDVYRYALAVTGQRSDAEDVTQTTFLNAYRAYARGERPRKPQNWLMTIAHNVCRQRARFAYYRVREVELEEGSVEALTPPDDIPTAADIRRALSHLPFQQRAVLIMRELEGRTHAEIAEVMGLTTQATEMLAFRGRRALREQLAGSLTCRQAASALDRQMDGTLDSDQAGLLRSHLRECEACEQLARRVRAQRVGWRAMAVVPLPASLSTFNHASTVLAGSGTAVGGAGAGLGAGIAAKVAAVTLAGVTIGGSAYLVKLDLPPLHAKPTHAAKAHVRHHKATHSSSRAATPSWQATPTSVAGSSPVRHHKDAQPVKKGEKHGSAPVETVPTAPTDPGSSPPQQPGEQPAGSTDQPTAADQDQPMQGDEALQADPQPQPADPTQQPPPSASHDNGVRAHGSPTPPAQPNGDGPQGKSHATPPPYSSAG